MFIEDTRLMYYFRAKGKGSYRLPRYEANTTQFPSMPNKKEEEEVEKRA